MNTATEPVTADEGGKEPKAPPTPTGVRKGKKKTAATDATAKPKTVTAEPAPVLEQTNTPQPADAPGASVNLLALLEANAQGSAGTGPALEIVRLGADQTPIIPFTPNAERIAVHYCSEPEISGYVQCNGSGCSLCKIGRRRDERLLIPVYLPASGVVGVLPVSPALRPHALFPQLAAVLKAAKPMVAFVARDRDRYTVSTAEIGPDVDAGEVQIKAFLAEQTAGRGKLSNVIATYANDQLAGVPAIARMLALRGAA